ncbi:MAG: hypothetical protein KIT58_07750 [Planctomycetota bacterium]|nr:hypothetical protein [Planctomycetota bacterium]
MAAIDPKELLKRNKVLVGGYVLAIVPVVLWFVVVAGAQDEYKKATTKLTGSARAASTMAKNITGNDPESPVYTDGDVERLKQKQDLYARELAALVQVVNGADVELERWFEAFKDTPTLSDFITELNKQADLLAEKYKPVVTGPDGTVHVYNEPPTGGALRTSQKRFWIQEAILEALTQAQAGDANAPIRPMPIRLVQKIDFPIPPPQERTDKPQAIERIPARVTISCPFPRIPLVVRELLSRTIPMRVAGIRVVQEPFSYESTDPRFAHFAETRPRFSVDGREYVFPQEAYTATLLSKEAYRGQEHWLPEPPVKVELTLETYDINPAGLPKAAPPAQDSDSDEGGN